MRSSLPTLPPKTALFRDGTLKKWSFLTSIPHQKAPKAPKAPKTDSLPMTAGFAHRPRYSFFALHCDNLADVIASAQPGAMVGRWR